MQSKGVAQRHTRSWLLLAGAISFGLPALVLSRMIAFTGEPELQPLTGAFIFGAGIVGAAFVLAWAGEVAELDISQGLALALVAFVAVLPEYAVDIYLAWQAGAEASAAVGADSLCEYCSYAAANMTGGNRLLVGLGWPVVVLVFWFKRKEQVVLGKGISLELAFLVIGAVYSLSLFFKGSIALWDSVVLFPIFGVYMWLSGRGERHEPDLRGPSLAVASLGTRGRRVVMVALFLYSAAVIIFSAELFAESLIEAGGELGIDEFILIQWVAPLASEAPEMLIATYFVLRGNPGAALTMLISATVNQWTLLVGSLPIAYSLSFGRPASLPLELRQRVEFLLTMAQTLFAVVLVSKARVSWKGATLLLGLFAAQLLFPQTEVRFSFAILFLGLMVVLFVGDRERRQGVLNLPGHVVAAVRS